MPILIRLLNLSYRNLNAKLLSIPTAPARLRCARSVSLIPLKRYMNEDKFAEKDKVPEGFKIIYRAPMESYVKAAKLVSTFTATFVGSLAVFKFATDNRFIQLQQELDLGGLVAHDSDMWIFASGFVAINASILYFLSKYPLRIYKNDKKYIAIYEGILPLGTTRFGFNQGETQESKHFLNPWSLITYKIKNRTTLLLLDYFKTPSEFYEMCADTPK